MSKRNKSKRIRTRVRSRQTARGARIRHGRIDVIDGKPIVGPETKRILSDHGLTAGSIFAGELMTCLICGTQQRALAGYESNWRAITIDDVTHYFCPAEYPPDAIATAEHFELAYKRCMAAILVVRAGDPLDPALFAPVDWRRP